MANRVQAIADYGVVLQIIATFGMEGNYVSMAVEIEDDANETKVRNRT